MGEIEEKALFGVSVSGLTLAPSVQVNHAFGVEWQLLEPGDRIPE